MTLSVHVLFFHRTPPPEIYTLSLHDALPIWQRRVERHAIKMILVPWAAGDRQPGGAHVRRQEGEARSEEHTSELQSRRDLVCRLLLEKKKIYTINSSACVAVNLGIREVMEFG